MTIKAEVKTMALKNLFDMVKADRYTADGREELNKAREADVEDARRTYQIGEISEATGLQKTANGWVKPKSGKQPGAKTGAGEVTRSQKKAIIRKELGLRGENDLDRFSDEQIEKMYQKTQQTPEQKKADFDNSKIGQAYNKARAETPRSGNTAKTDQSTKKAIEKYKNLPGPQKKDALNAASYEGSPVGMTQEGMERQGWDLVESDDQINVYAKPDGSKVTMKHDGKTITETNYEAPASGSKPAESKWTKTKDYQDRERISMKTPQGGMVSIYETDNPGQKNNRFRVDTGSHANYFNTMEEAKAFAEKHYGEGSESKPAVEGWEETRMASGKIYDLKSQGKRIIEQYDPETETKTFKLRDLNNSRTPDKEFKSLEEAKTAAESKPEGTTPSLSKEDKIRMLSNSKHRSFSSVPVSEWAETYSKLSDKELDEAYEDFLKFRNPDDYKAGGKFDYAGRTGDAAPRVLTGDTRIRVKKA